MPCASRRKVPGCVPDVRIEVSRAAWSKHWRQCVWLTCLTPTRVTLASRCSKRTAGKLPRGGTCARAKSTYCDLSSFGPPLFEIWWPDIYLGGPYGPVKDKMYWPGGLKSAPGQRASAYVEGWHWVLYNYQRYCHFVIIYLVYCCYWFIVRIHRFICLCVSRLWHNQISFTCLPVSIIHTNIFCTLSIDTHQLHYIPLHHFMI